MSDAIRATVVFSTADDPSDKGLYPFDYEHKSNAYLVQADLTLAEYGECLPATADGWRVLVAEQVRRIHGVRTLAVYSVELHLVGER